MARPDEPKSDLEQALDQSLDEVLGSLKASPTPQPKPQAEAPPAGSDLAGALDRSLDEVIEGMGAGQRAEPPTKERPDVSAVFNVEAPPEGEPGEPAPAKLPGKSMLGRVLDRAAAAVTPSDVPRGTPPDVSAAFGVEAPPEGGGEEPAPAARPAAARPSPPELDLLRSKPPLTVAAGGVPQAAAMGTQARALPPRRALAAEEKESLIPRAIAPGTAATAREASAERPGEQALGEHQDRLVAESGAMEQERERLVAEKRAFDQMKAQHPKGLPADQAEPLNRRIEAHNRAVKAFDERVRAYRQQVVDFRRQASTIDQPAERFRQLPEAERVAAALEAGRPEQALVEDLPGGGKKLTARLELPAAAKGAVPLETPKEVAGSVFETTGERAARPARELGHGLTAGTLQMAEAVGTSFKAGGVVTGSQSLKDAGEIIASYWHEQAEAFGPSKVSGKSLWDQPEMLVNPSWLAYSFGQTVPSLAATIVPAVGTQAAMIRVGGRLLPYSPQVVGRLARIGSSVAGSGVGGFLEGASTFEEIKRKGGSDRDAVLSMGLMAGASAGLNAISLARILSAEGIGLKPFLKAGLVEGLTEWLEEPTEAGIKWAGGYMTFAEAMQQLKDGLNVVPAAFLTGGLAQVAFNARAPEVEAPRVRVAPRPEPAQAPRPVAEERPVPEAAAVPPGPEPVAAERPIPVEVEQAIRRLAEEGATRLEAEQAPAPVPEGEAQAPVQPPSAGPSPDAIRNIMILMRADLEAAAPVAGPGEVRAPSTYPTWMAELGVQQTQTNADRLMAEIDQMEAGQEPGPLGEAITRWAGEQAVRFYRPEQFETRAQVPDDFRDFFAAQQTEDRQAFEQLMAREMANVQSQDPEAVVNLSLEALTQDQIPAILDRFGSHETILQTVFGGDRQALVQSLEGARQLPVEPQVPEARVQAKQEPFGGPSSGVVSGWVAPDGRIEQAPGSAEHFNILTDRLGGGTTEEFVERGTVRFVEAGDYMGVEVDASHPDALQRAIHLIQDRGRGRPDVYVDYIGGPRAFTGAPQAAIADLQKKIADLARPTQELAAERERPAPEEPTQEVRARQRPLPSAEPVAEGQAQEAGREAARPGDRLGPVLEALQGLHQKIDAISARPSERRAEREPEPRQEPVPGTGGRVVPPTKTRAEKPQREVKALPLFRPEPIGTQEELPFSILEASEKAQDKALKKEPPPSAEPPLAVREAQRYLHLDPVLARAEGNPAFQRWFKGSKVVAQDGRPLIVYHGATWAIGTFDRRRGNPDSAFGPGFYFSDEPDDAGLNYAGQGRAKLGPDLRSRIERRAEQIEQELETRYQQRAAGRPKEPQGGRRLYDVGMRMAISELFGGRPNVIPAFLSLRNPVIIEKNGGTTFEIQLSRGRERGNGVKLYEAFIQVGQEMGFDGQRAWNEVSADLNFDDGPTAAEVYRQMQRSDTLSDVTNEAGDMVLGDAMARIFEQAGFDGVILKNAELHYMNMGLGHGTTHYVAFRPEQIKSAIGNRWTYNRRMADIARAPQVAFAEQRTAMALPEGFYSRLYEAVERLPATTFRQQVENRLKAAGVSQDEIQWTGLGEWIQERKGQVKRQEILHFLAEQPAYVTVRVLGDARDMEALREAERLGERAVREEKRIQIAFKERMRGPMFDEFMAAWDRSPSDKRLEGVSRETIEQMTRDSVARMIEYWDTPSARDLFTSANWKSIIAQEPALEEERLLALDQMVVARRDQHESLDRAEALHRKVATRYQEHTLTGEPAAGLYIEAVFQTPGAQEREISHFRGLDPTFWLRATGRETTDGKRLLLVEEVQSDVHQKGAKRGYMEPGRLAIVRQAYLDLKKREKDLALEISAIGHTLLNGDHLSTDAYIKLRGRGESLGREFEQVMTEREKMAKTLSEPPSSPAPFSKTWYQMAMKWAIRYAAQNNLDGIGWTTGAQQEQRWGQVERKGMRMFYDETLVNWAKRYSGQWGGTVSTAHIPIAGALQIVQDGYSRWVLYDPVRNEQHVKPGDDHPLAFKSWAAARDWLAQYGKGLTGLPVHQVALTPEMRDSVLGRGQAVMAGQAPFREPAPTFYSPLVRAIEARMPARASIEQVRAILKSPGVKEDEVRWSGAEAILTGPSSGEPISKEDLLAALQPVTVDEVVLGQDDPLAQRRWTERLRELDEVWSKAYSDLSDAGEALVAALKTAGLTPIESRKAVQDLQAQRLRRVGDQDTPRTNHYLDIWQRLGGGPESITASFRASNLLNAVWEGARVSADAATAYNQHREHKPEPPIPQYEKWTLPGGDTYRELLLRWHGSGEYQQPHFKQWPNVLAHARYKIRRDQDGRRLLFVEEIQSDWHQAGRKRGYQSFDARRQLEAIDRQLDALHERGDITKDRILGVEYNRLMADRNRLLATRDREDSEIPAAPFAKTWHELVLKRLVRLAADEGLDGIGWTTGKQQADRYSLTKYIDEIRYAQTPDGRYNLTAMKDGKIVPLAGDQGQFDAMEPRELAGLVGEEIAARILAGEGEEFIHESTRQLRARGRPVEVFEKRTGSWESTRRMGGWHIRYETGQEFGVWLRREDAEREAQRQSLEFDRPGSRFLKTGDLTIGGQGMRAFYDQMLPGFANRYMKAWGAKVETANFVGPGEEIRAMTIGNAMARWPDLNITGVMPGDWVVVNLVGARPKTVGIYPSRSVAEEARKEMLALGEQQTFKAHALYLTQEMKESVVYEGQAVMAQQRSFEDVRSHTPSLLQSRVHTKVYFGTRRAFGGFEVEKAHPRAPFGPGVYFYEDQESAIQHTMRHPTDVGSPATLPAYLAVYKPFRIGAGNLMIHAGDRDVLFQRGLVLYPDYDWDAVVRKRPALTGETYKAIQQATNSAGNPLGKGKANKILEAEGYDAIQYEKNGVGGWMVFDPSAAIPAAQVEQAAEVALRPKEPEPLFHKRMQPPWYMKSVRVIQARMPERASPEQVMNILKAGGVREVEIKLSGIEAFLTPTSRTPAEKSVGKQEVLSLLTGNLSSLQDREYRGEGAEELSIEWSDPTMVEPSREQVDEEVKFYMGEDPELTEEEARDRAWESLTDPAIAEQNIVGSDQFGNQYELYGSDNIGDWAVVVNGLNYGSRSGQRHAERWAEELGADLVEKDESRGGEGPTQYTQYTLPGGEDHREVLLTWQGLGYVSPHWDEASGVIAHFRVGYYAAPETGGADVPVVNEFQSDLAGELRRAGAGGEELQTDPAYADWLGFAPHWAEFTAKAAIRWAVQNDEKRLAWLTGQQVAGLYDLSKRVDALHYYADTARLTAERKGVIVIERVGVSPERLADFVGKSVAERLMAQEPYATIPGVSNRRSLRGEDLQVGGKWTTALYDERIPRFMAKYAKQWGGTVEKTKVMTDAREGGVEGAEVWVLNIPDQMATALREEGLAVFDRVRTFRTRKGDDDPGLRQMALLDLDEAAGRPDAWKLLGFGVTPPATFDGRVALMGQRLSGDPREMAHQLAALTQTVRNPLWETFTIFAVGPDGRLLDYRAVSARLPGLAPVVPGEMGPLSWFEELRGWMKRLGASSYYIHHNHPTGNPDPSNEDLAVSRRFDDEVPGYAGHVVIDSGRYAIIGKKFDVQIVQKDFGPDLLLRASVPHPFLGQQAGPEQIARMGRALKRADNVVLFYMNAEMQVRAIQSVPQSVFYDRDVAVRLGDHKRNFGANRVVAYASGASDPELPRRLRTTLSVLRFEHHLMASVEDGVSMFVAGDEFQEDPLTREIMRTGARQVRARQRPFDQPTAREWADLQTVGRHFLAQTPDQAEWKRLVGARLPERFTRHLDGLYRQLTMEGPNTRALPSEPAVAGADPQALQATTRSGLQAAVSLFRSTPADVERNDLIARIRALINREIRTGRMAQRKSVLGIFKPRPEVIRLRNAGALQTLSHEVGHFISQRLFGPSARPSPERRAFEQRHAATLLTLAGTQRNPNVEEGLAEWFRQYLTNQAATHQAFPALSRELEDLMAAKDRAFLTGLQNIGADYQAWRARSVADRIESHISFDHRAPSQSVIESLHHLYAAVISERHFIGRAATALAGGRRLPADQDPTVMRDALAGMPRVAELFLFRAFGHGGAVDFENRRKVGPALEEVLEPIAPDIRKWSVYMIARRMQELADRPDEAGKRSFALLAEAIETDRAGVNQVVTDSEERFPAFREAHDSFQTWNQTLLKYLADSGVLSADTMGKITDLNRSYFPFFRFFGDEATAGLPGGTPQPSAGLKKLKGSGRQILDPLESAVRNTYALVMQAERNAIKRSLADLADKAQGEGRWMEKVPPQQQATKVPVGEVLKQLKNALVAAGIPDEFVQTMDPEAITEVVTLFRPDHLKLEPNEIVVMREGKPNHYIVDPNLKQSLDVMDRAEADILNRYIYGWLPQPWMKTFASLVVEGPARLLRKGATLAPEFIGRNPLRDTFTRAAYTQAPTNIPIVGAWWDLLRAIGGTVQGARSAIFKDRWWDAWTRGGGQIALAGLDRLSAQRRLKEVLEGRFEGRPSYWAVRPIQVLQAVSEVMEHANRIAETRAVLGRMGVEPEQATKAQLTEAGAAARDVTLDFQRFGYLVKAAGVNRIAAFFNASLQGHDKLWRQMKLHPYRTVHFLLSTITLPSLALLLYNYQDPRWKEIPQWQKDISWIVFSRVITPEEWASMDEEARLRAMQTGVWRIPKPFELGVLFGSIPERIAEWMLGQNPNIGRSMMQAVGSALGTSLIPVPTLLYPVVGAYMNWNLFFERPIVPGRLAQLEPEFQVSSSTSQTAQGIAAGLSKITRQSEVTPWLRSPLMVDYFLQAYGGNLARLGTNAVDEFVKQFEPGRPADPAKTWADIPGIRGFASRYPTSNAVSVREFFDLYNRTQRAATTLEFQNKRGKVPESFIKERALDLMMAPSLKAVAEDLAAMRAQMQDVRDSEEMTAREKRDTLDRITLMMVERAREAVSEYRGVEQQMTREARP